MTRIKSKDLARAIIVSLAHHHSDYFCVFNFYDYDMEFVDAVAKRIGQERCPIDRLLNAMRRVCRQLENCGVLYGRVSSCHKEYLGEPTRLKSYRFANPAYKWRINPESNPDYKGEYSVDFEIDWLVEKAYQ
jgi:hypothetical protein